MLIQGGPSPEKDTTDFMPGFQDRIYMAVAVRASIQERLWPSQPLKKEF